MSAITVTVMCSATLDGKLAPATDASSRPFLEHVPDRFGDQLGDLREAVDGIVVGNETVVQDDSRLVPPSGSELVRTVIDPEAKLRPEHTILADEYPTVVAVTGDTPDAHRERIERRENKRTVLVGDDEVDLHRLCEELSRMGVDHLLLEGGGRLIFYFLEAELVDEMRILYMPYVVGGEAVVTLADGTDSLFPNVRLNVEDRQVDGDFTLLEGTVDYGGPVDCGDTVDYGDTE